MKRRDVLRLTAAAASAWSAWSAVASEVLPAVQVYKTPRCGCCGAWVEHLKAAGFAVTVHDVADTAPTRARLGLSERFGSCHTAVVAGYVVEGHVPARDIKKLLAMKPVAIGLAVPGMPVGSPGMEVDSRQDPYQVVLVDKQGRGTVFSSYPGNRGG